MPEKTRLRAEVLARRDALADGGSRSASIVDRVRRLPEYAAAHTVALFIGVRSEVETLPLVEAALAEGKRVAVPWVSGDDLRLFALARSSELAPAAFGLLEPPGWLRNAHARNVAPASVDLFLVPGVAFDRLGGRLGHGRGFYDRLLARSRPGVPLVALAFECQVVEAVPMTHSDVAMHAVVTEDAVHRI